MAVLLQTVTRYRYFTVQEREDRNRIIPVERLDVLGSSEGFSQHVRHRHGAMGQVTGLNRKGNMNSHPVNIVNSDSKIKKPFSIRYALLDELFILPP